VWGKEERVSFRGRDEVGLVEVKSKRVRKKRGWMGEERELTITSKT
jgi:hypothetical protein